MIREAVEVARDGHLVTIGVEPTGPATGFGYIRTGAPLAGAATALQAVEFVEKPDAERAEAYVASGEYRWNAGMFVVRATLLLDLLERWHPDLAARAEGRRRRPVAARGALARADADRHRPRGGGAGRGCRSRRRRSRPLRLGRRGRLREPLGAAPGTRRAELRVLGDAQDVTAVDASGVVVAASGRRVAVVGLDDVVVVDTPDAVLVTTRARAQDVKRVVDALKAEGRDRPHLTSRHPDFLRITHVHTRDVQSADPRGGITSTAVGSVR